MALKQVQTTCAYCGAGCQIMFTVDTDANKIVEAVPADGRTNAGTLCLKGHYGWDYLNDPQILTKRLRKPMIRKGGKKSPPCRGFLGGSNFLCSETSWGNKEKFGPDSIMGTGSARGQETEANYLMQKFMRACIGTNNVDHCARI